MIPLFVGSAAAWEEPKGFRDIPWGSPPSVVAEQLKGKERFDSVSCYGITSCNGYVSIADVRTFVHITFDTGGMDHIGMIFPTGGFSKMKLIFIDRYGPPTSSRSEGVQNRMGAKYENEILEWTGETVNIRLSRYGSKLTDSSGTIETRAAAQNRREQFEKKVKEGKKDL
jgi:hypothetical protein